MGGKENEEEEKKIGQKSGWWWKCYKLNESGKNRKFEMILSLINFECKVYSFGWLYGGRDCIMDMTKGGQVHKRK